MIRLFGSLWIKMRQIVTTVKFVSEPFFIGDS